jgi:uncharacterized protein YndB with AHSA1/START domain
VDTVSSLEAPCGAERVFAAVADLADYPDWLSIVNRAQPAEPAPADGGPAWLVELRGRLGPLARSKRLRMVRTVVDAPHHLRFERRELDGRAHSPWILDAEVEPRDGGSRLTMRLHYGGAFGGATLERMLAAEIEDSHPRLLALLA